MVGETVLVSCDPGLRELGLSVFEGRVLKETYLVRNPEKKIRGPKAWEAMVDEIMRYLPKTITTYATEYPQYDSRFRKIDPRDLLELQGIAAIALGWMHGAANSDLFAYTPSEWKGSTPKDIHQPRILAALSPVETKVIEATVGPKSKLHNVVDSVGIGLFHLGRLTK